MLFLLTNSVTTKALQVGDEVEVMVDRREDKSGQLQLSHKKARTLKAWDRVNELPRVWRNRKRFRKI